MIKYNSLSNKYLVKLCDIKVGFLQRDELTYELLCRAVTFKHNATEDRMRKLLKNAIKTNLNSVLK